MVYFDLNEISLDKGGSHIDSPEWIKNKKATINPQNKKYDKCFQYALLVADVFKNSRNMCIKVYELDPAYFLSAPGFAWQTCLKRTKIKLELLTDVDMLLMVEKGIRGGICHAIYRYVKASSKYMKNYNKYKEESFIQYLDAKNLYGWAMSQKLLVSGVKWKKNMSKFTKEFIKIYDEDSDKGYILEVDVKYPKKLHELHSDLPF